MLDAREENIPSPWSLPTQIVQYLCHSWCNTETVFRTRPWILEQKSMHVLT